METPEQLADDLFHRTVLARQRVYQVRPPTPLERLDLDVPCEVWVKREDQPPMHAYKWRGAYNRVATLEPEQRRRGLVCASAGNHAQGVAIAAHRFGCRARVFMPRPTPVMKQQAVRRLGGSSVEIVLVGDTYDDAAQAAKQAAEEEGLAFVHPFDDLETMAGQGTIGDEIVMSGAGPFDVAVLPIGGGGLAASVANYLKRFWPGIEVIGVEGEDQASMAAAVAAGKPVRLDHLDIFCDGTAVRTAGTLTTRLCGHLIDRFVQVSNEEVSTAIRAFWDARRRVVEPAGALGMAAIRRLAHELAGRRVVTITCGANMDFSQLAVVAAEAGVGAPRRHVRFEVPERSGGLLEVVETCFRSTSITDFQYGKTGREVGRPVLGFDATDDQLAALLRRAEAAGIPAVDATHDPDVAFRMIHFRPDLLAHALPIRLAFPERAGALREFLAAIRDAAFGAPNIGYFSYVYTGERLGRALLVLEFADPVARSRFGEAMAAHERFHDAWEPLDPDAAARVLS